VTRWATIPLDVTHLYSPVGLRLVDELTGGSPLGNVSATLDVLEMDGSWRQTDIREVRTPSNVVAYPGLERHADVTGLKPQQYRVRLEAEFYVPFYRANSNGISFTAHPYNDTNPPAVIVGMAIDTLLLPGPNYPFVTHIPVLRGLVIDTARKPVLDAYVTQSNNERTLTDSRGTFALPLRWAQLNVRISIDATDQRTGRHGSIQIRLPDSLRQSQTIPIS
jgi:hypothetical protein